ncbi:succinate dehydrogenase/fumarate reductase iron-sulfur subunit [Sulfurimonas sp. HSL1-2]|uniref:succinate dehydrogenase/fumarate reductase iron-sulfur subunit n=1 Tax=Thiomicrolovo zhangzhouensis TaxID=3131933 RepID=UPI0031F814EA
MTTITTQTITFNVFRFNSETDYLPYYKKVEMEVTSEEVVLDILNRIKWEVDGSFSYRRSCRHGICGACAIKVNGKGVLACKERMNDLIELFGTELTLEPLSIKRAVKDMIIDKEDFWVKHEAIEPYLISHIEEHPEMECAVTPAQAEALLDSDYCIQCGLCHYSCPVIEINDDFIGPAAFAKAYRFNADVRDDGIDERLDIINAPSAGVWDCVKCFECAEVCPKEVNPIEKITKLHNQIFEHGRAINNVATRHAVGFAHSIKKHGLLDEAELVRYSEGTLPMLMKHGKVGFKMFKVGKVVMPWNMPKSDKLDEVKALIKSSSTVKF